MNRSSPESRFAGAYSPDYLARKQRPLDRHYVAVQTAKRGALVHAVEASSFGAVAQAVVKGAPIATCCGRPVQTNWSFVVRGEKSPVTCPACFAVACPSEGRRVA